MLCIKVVILKMQKLKPTGIEENGNPVTALECQPQTLSKSCKQANPGEASTPWGSGDAMGEV